MSTTLELMGVDSLIEKLNDVGKKSNKAVNAALKEGGNIILEDAKHTTSFKDRTGTLRKALKKSTVKTSKGTKLIWIGDVDRKAPYSWYVEYGHSNTPARPFLRPAYEKNKKAAYAKIKEKLHEELMK